MSRSRDEEHGRDERLSGADAEVSSEPVVARRDLPDDHLDYTTCDDCGRRYRSGGTHICPKKRA
jgi:hypothetical protein